VRVAAAIVGLFVAALVAIVLVRGTPETSSAQPGPMSLLIVRARALGDGRIRFGIHVESKERLPEQIVLTFPGMMVENVESSATGIAGGAVVGADPPNRVSVSFKRGDITPWPDPTKLTLELVARPTIIRYAFGHRTAFIPWLDDFGIGKAPGAPTETETVILDGLPVYPNGGKDFRCGPVPHRECREFGYGSRRWFIAIGTAHDPLGWMLATLATVMVGFLACCRAAYRRRGELVEVVEAADYRSTEVQRVRRAPVDARQFVARVLLTFVALMLSLLAIVFFCDGYSPYPMPRVVALAALGFGTLASASLFLRGARVRASA
jgi:hypothetical protein